MFQYTRTRERCQFTRVDIVQKCAIIQIKGNAVCWAVSFQVQSKVFTDDRTVAAGRSSRIYEENVQYNDCTYEELKCFLSHPRHPLSASDRGEGKERADRCSMQTGVSLHPVYHAGAKPVNLRRTCPVGRFFVRKCLGNTAQLKPRLLAQAPVALPRCFAEILCPDFVTVSR